MAARPCEDRRYRDELLTRPPVPWRIMSSRGHGMTQTPRQRQDARVLFVVTYEDGSRGLIRVPPVIAGTGGTPPTVMRYAAEEQLRGVLKSGPITGLVRLR